MMPFFAIKTVSSICDMACKVIVVMSLWIQLADTSYGFILAASLVNHYFEKNICSLINKHNSIEGERTKYVRKPHYNRPSKN